MAPSVTILVPTLNEEAAIEACLSSLVSQEYEGVFEIFVIDGGSTDETREIARRFPLVRVLDNPMKRQSWGLNLGATASDAEILVRADAHSTYEADYVQRSIDVLGERKAQAVGGPMRAKGFTPIERAIAAAMGTPLGIGVAKFHSPGASGSADTVYLGAFRRDHFLTREGYRHFRSGVAEDADLYYRWRAAGDLVYLDPSIRSEYRPRGSFSKLAKQFFRYGVGKSDMWYQNGTLPSWRPLGPLGLVVALLFAGGLALSGVSGPLLLVASSWAVVVVLAWVQSQSWNPLVMLAVAVMHFTYGFGLVWGLLPRRSSRLES